VVGGRGRLKALFFRRGQVMSQHQPVCLCNAGGSYRSSGAAAAVEGSGRLQGRAEGVR